MMESPDVAHVDFTPNAHRSISIDGYMDESLEKRLRPQILELTRSSRDPITVFINSSGGSTKIVEGILSLLRPTDQVDARPSRIITFAESQAKSAAAQLLSAGDFAIASRESKLLYHGTRIEMPRFVTGEQSMVFADGLTASNEMFAASLAQKSVRRFLWIVSALRSTFEQHRADVGDSTLTDLDCFGEILFRKLSPSAQNVLSRANRIWNTSKGLVTHFQKKIGRGRGHRSGKADLQKIMLNASMAFEYQSNSDNPDWSLSCGGLKRIREHYAFLEEHFQNATGDQVGKLCERWAPSTPAKEDEHDVDAAYFLPFRSFFVAICRALQQGENNLTAVDAMFLGLVDTVRDLPK
jgi:ATP-dependent protease ClpP protease subunit